jgi:uncharacterized OsmC-like protein
MGGDCRAGDKGNVLMGVIIPKRWSASVLSRTNQPLELFYGGQLVKGANASTLEDVSPVEHLLIAVASCFALSCHSALRARKIAPLDYRVVATGDRALEPPSRLSNLDISVIFADTIAEDEASAVVQDARARCTVINTLQLAPSVLASTQRRASGDLGHPPRLSAAGGRR